ncbi:MAG TPA: DUF1080 domain-containing protein [Verrucomicrobiae bacterium]|nr:DUF1080 domain-containing protein [Verrucomicrobiae bacterium]
MRSCCWLFLLIGAICRMPAADEPRTGGGSPPPGFKELFNGRDLSGWWGAETEDPRKYMDLPAAGLQRKKVASLADIRRHWSVEGDELVNDGGGLYLTTDEFFGNFELRLEYKTVSGADSGIYLRGCPQVQIWDSTDASKFAIGADKGSGGLWNNPAGAAGKDPLAKADRPFGEWNQFRIVMIGARVWVWLNGVQTVNGATMHHYFSREVPIPALGPIQLQTHGGEIRWRNIFLRPVDNGEAVDWLRRAELAGLDPLFNGRDFSGWLGATNSFEIAEGVIACRKGQSGTLYSARQFTNFTVRVEFNLPPGGNNGLALRYPGQGDPAYSGMCELQVLDERYEAVTGRKIDPRQAHGSAYGMVAAVRGYQFPAGEWNFQEITVRGSRITAELNGTPILDADLSKVREFMGNNAHPGKDRAFGHFGFAGHNDAVKFRNIFIQHIP